jgi:hypothetical protein
MTTSSFPSAAPQPPREPDPAECCQSGCVRCVYDLYAEACETYRRALTDWERGQRLKAVEKINIQT